MTFERIGVVVACLSVVFFPWPLSAMLALGIAVVEPLTPLIVGVLADTLYYVPQAGSVPLYTILGVLVTLVAYLVRNQLKTV